VSTLLETEIAQQGAALRDRSLAGSAPAADAARVLGGPDVSHVVIAARGSSDNAARFAQYLFGSELRLQVGLAAPWLYRDPERAPTLAGAAVIGISQSGQSPDVVGVLAAARRQGRPTVAVTADPDAALALQADVVVPLAVVERSVAATKTYTATLHALVQIVEAISPDPRRRKWLDAIPEFVTATAAHLLTRRAAFDCLLDVPLITVTGRGLAYSAACETALKVRELAGIPAEAFSPPDLMHGPIAGLDGRGATWSIEPSNEELAALADRSAVTVVVGPASPGTARATMHVPLPVEPPAWARALLAVIPGQAAGLRLAERRGADVDNPHGLTKVTLTR
jgi:glucosamine--fructose-6-phosphate aminotransferase (isomerizing)